MNRILWLTVITLLNASTTILACAWDYDTIKMERSRFPSTLELITGKFLRHSPEFYQWRIENRLERLKSEPDNVALLDDLGVAYDKIGRQDKAIETALAAENIKPGRYETAANLGTFYLHAGDLSNGILHIERALAINPDAHFGRERYQLLLAEHLVERQDAGHKTLPLATIEGDVNAKSHGVHIRLNDTFTGYLHVQGHDLQDGIKKPIEGILGMMKFGNHKSPVLLEALGLLLSHEYDPQRDAKRLAARAFLKASYEVRDELAIQSYRAMARNALGMQTTRRDSMEQITLEQIESEFRNELDEANEWYLNLHESEKSWIENGLDPEKEFDKLYAAEPAQSGMNLIDPPTHDEMVGRRIRVVLITALCFSLAILAGGIIAVMRYRKRRASEK
jgi:tetratricopeptide (TPR) repeat protein